jgi:hypothetical protein
MGAWRTAAWDNDDACDWYSELFHETGLAGRVEEALNRDLGEEDPEVLRAAAYLVVALGCRADIWPIELLDKPLSLAIDKLELVRATYQGHSGFEAAIAGELAELRSKLAVLRSRLGPPDDRGRNRPSGVEW